MTYFLKNATASSPVPVKASRPSAIKYILSNISYNSEDGWCRVTIIVLPRPVSCVKKNFSHYIFQWHLWLFKHREIWYHDVYVKRFHYLKDFLTPISLVGPCRNPDRMSVHRKSIMEDLLELRMQMKASSFPRQKYPLLCRVLQWWYFGILSKRAT